MSTIKVGTLLAADGSTTTQPSIPALDKRMAKAWVHFNGQSTIAILDSYNVSSLTDHGTGNYSANFQTNMSSTHYTSVGGCIGASAGWYSNVLGGYLPTVGSIRFKTPNVVDANNLVLQDLNRVNIIVFGA